MSRTHIGPLMGDIGEPRRHITVEPIEVPVPVPEKVPA